MTEVILYDGTKWFLQKKIKENLDILIQNVKASELDLVIVIDGHEGWGKSFAARGLGRYIATKLGTTFGVDDIYFDTTTYINASTAAGSAKRTGRHKINVLDEGRHALNRKRSMSKMGVQFTNYLSECRGLGQVHLILAPAYHDLERYLIMWRMQLLIHFRKNYVKSVESESGFLAKRGEYRLYTDRKWLNIFYYKQYDYPKKFDDRNWWSTKEVFGGDELEVYDLKKEAATIAKYAEKPEEDNEKHEVPGSEEGFVKIRALVDLTGLKRDTIIDKIQKGLMEGYKFGGVWLVHKSEVQKVRDGTSAWFGDSGNSGVGLVTNERVKESEQSNETERNDDNI